MLGGKFHEDWKFGLVLNFIQKGQDKTISLHTQQITTTEEG
jgi:hypothetical protein